MRKLKAEKEQAVARTTTTTASDVAKYLIHLASKNIIGADELREGMSHGKLQKFLYFCQAHHLGQHLAPLFSDEIEAREYGPKIMAIYEEYGKNGSEPMIEPRDLSSLNPAKKYFVDSMWDYIGDGSAVYLMQESLKDKPWVEVYNGLANASDKKIITHDAMFDSYRKRYISRFDYDYFSVPAKISHNLKKVGLKTLGYVGVKIEVNN